MKKYWRRRTKIAKYELGSKGGFQNTRNILKMG
jgi:hypothetical protein